MTFHVLRLSNMNVVVPLCFEAQRFLCVVSCVATLKREGLAQASKKDSKRLAPRE